MTEPDISAMRIDSARAAAAQALLEAATDPEQRADLLAAAAVLVRRARGLPVNNAAIPRRVARIIEGIEKTTEK